MKILRLLHSLNPAGGGVAEGVSQLTPHLNNLGASTTVATLDLPDSPWLQHLHFSTIGLGPVFNGFGYKRGLPSRILDLARHHDVVIIEGIWNYHSLATWRALRSSGIPYFVYTHGMLDPWFKRSYPFKHLKKWLYWTFAEYRVLRDATAVLFTTEQERILASQSFWFYQAKELVVGYGTSPPPGDSDQQRNIFLARFPHLCNKRTFLFLSRIHPKKGVDLLIEAFALVADFDPLLHLVVAGPDQAGLQAQLQQRAAVLGISDRITWTGMLSGDLKWGAFHAAELFCLPSHQENFGIVVAEALACGLPVAISESVNISGHVSAGGAGLVHDDTIYGTTEALRIWLSLGIAEQQLMGKKGRQLFDYRFECTSVARKLLSVLQDAI
jgi:glycosyltransferase involved in cell wall biosynthesis